MKPMTIPEFLAKPIKSREAKVTIHIIAVKDIDWVAKARDVRMLMLLSGVLVGVTTPDMALGADGPVSRAFDERVWPLIVDIGNPLAKTMMAFGLYNVIRNNTEKGWKMIKVAAFGLAGIYLIDGAIAIIEGIGVDMQKPIQATAPVKP